MYLIITTSHECRPKKMLYIKLRQWADKSQEAQWTQVVQNQSEAKSLWSRQTMLAFITRKKDTVQRPITRKDNALHSSIQLYIQIATNT